MGQYYKVTEDGVKFPSKTTSEIEGLSNPENGLVIHDITKGEFVINNGTSNTPSWNKTNKRCYMRISSSNPQNTAISAKNIPQKITAVTTSSGYGGLTMDEDNRIINSSGNELEVKITAVLNTKKIGNSSYINANFYINKSGAILYDSISPASFNSQISFSNTIIWTTTLEPNDYIELWGENTSNNNSIRVNILNLIIESI
jgi:hypothetical protein